MSICDPDMQSIPCISKKYTQIEQAKHTLRHIFDIQDIPLSITLIININNKCVLS